MLPFSPELRSQLLAADPHLTPTELDAIEALIARRVGIDDAVDPAEAQSLDQEIGERVSKINDYEKIVPGADIAALLRKPHT